MNLHSPSQKSQNFLKILSSIFAVVIVALIISIKDQIGQFRQWGYFGIFLVSFIGNATILVPVPVLATIGALGATLDPFSVGAIASLGAAFGESLGYFLGLAGNVVASQSPQYDKVKSTIEKYGAWAILALASFPNPIFDLAGIIAGVLGVSYRKFFLAVWIGTFLKYTLVSFIGFSLSTYKLPF